MFCAPSRMLESRIAFETSPSAVNGGQTTMSTSLTLAKSILRLRTRSSASATVLFIFQFPAIISFRSLFIKGLRLCVRLFLAQGGHARQDLAFEEFEARAAAGAHEGHFVAQLGFVQRLNAVAAADDALGAALLRHLRHCAGNGECAFRKSFILEQPHRSEDHTSELQ